MKRACSLLSAFALLMLAIPLAGAATSISHVLVISIDGLHAFDLRRYVRAHPRSALATLEADGIEYANAHVDVPADSFPGIVGIFTGATPAESGVYYDMTYDRALAATAGECRAGRFGARVPYNEAVDAHGEAGVASVIDPMKLPLRPDGCTPVYPHDYLRTNTIFEVVRAAGGYTAWIDKHPVYEILNGPSGRGIDDLFTPEIGGDFEGNTSLDRTHVTGSIAGTEAYDAMKVRALLAEVAGWRHDHTVRAPVPTVFGTNLQALNVAQKLDGYEDSSGTPSPPLEAALMQCNLELADIVAALRRNQLYGSTLFILTAKHGNAPVNPERVRHIDKSALRRVINTVAPDGIAQLTADQGALIWLRQPGEVSKAAQALRAAKVKLGIQKVLVGSEIRTVFSAKADDSRVPDVVVVAQSGVIYGNLGDTKFAEHGGFDDENTHVGLLISNPHLVNRGVRTSLRVSTRQIAPTILAVLDIPAARLHVEKANRVPALPVENWAHFIR